MRNIAKRVHQFNLLGKNKKKNRVEKKGIIKMRKEERKDEKKGKREKAEVEKSYVQKSYIYSGIATASNEL